MQAVNRQVKGRDKETEKGRDEDIRRKKETARQREQKIAKEMNSLIVIKFDLDCIVIIKY